MKPRMEMDKISNLVTVDTSVRWGDLNRWLAKHGLKIPLRPLPNQKWSVRQILERGCSDIRDICISLEAKTPVGPVLIKRVPRAATGPDFKRLLIGTGGRYGKALKATLHFVNEPERRERHFFKWRNEAAQKVFLRRLAGSGIHPASVESGNCRVGLILEGTSKLVAAEARTLKRLVKETRGSHGS